MFLKATIAFSFSVLFSSAWAKTQMTVVENYSKATEKAVWEKVKKSELPPVLLKSVTLENPAMAYAFPFNDLFLQNSAFYLCLESCDLPQNFKVTGNGEDFQVEFESFEKRKTRKEDLQTIQQASVYYWLTTFFEKLEERVGFTMDHRLKVLVGRKTRDIQTGKKEHNNAFYNSIDHSLSFLPAKNGLIGLIAGAKLRPSALDPSVAIHEAGHAVFKQVFGNYLNAEIGGLDEGFADYMAMMVLETDKVGSVMMSGGNIRDLSKLKMYAPGMEVHDLGEVFASQLWFMRKNIFPDTLTADKIFFEAVTRMGKVLTATALNFPQFHNRVVKEYYPQDAKLQKEVEEVWYTAFGSYRLLEVSTEALAGPVNSKGFHTSHFSAEYPLEIAKDFGIPTFQQFQLTLIEVRDNPAIENSKWYLLALTKDGVVTPVWFLYHSRFDAVLDTRDFNGRQITSSDVEMAAIVKLIGENLSSLIDWSEQFGKDFASIITRKGELATLYRAKGLKTKNAFLPINGKLVPAQVHTAKLKNTFIAKLLGVFMGGAGSALNAFDEITFYTVKKGSLKSEEKLVTLFEGQLLIGYEVQTKTGVKTKILLNHLD